MAVERDTFPAVASPTLPDEPTTMMITSEKVTQKSITRPRLSVHHTSFLWASFACQELVLSTTQRLVAPSGAEALPSERSRRSECALVAAGGYSRSRSRDPDGCWCSGATLPASVPLHRGSRSTAANRGGLPER